MNTEREVKVNMYHSVTDLCDNNAAIVALVVAFGTAYNIFKTTVTAIAQGMADLSAQTGGYRVAKDAAKGTLATMGSGIAGMVYAYASVTNNDVLKNTVNIPKSKISRALDDEVQGICMNIYDTANANIANLADYGVTPALLATYLTAINDYVAKAPKPKQSQNYKQMVEEQVSTMVRDADKILNEQMDKLVVNYLSNGNEEFEGQYRQARKINDAGTFTTVLKIQVLNSVSGLPVVGAKVYRDAAGTFKLTSKKGFVTFKDIEQGNHSFVIKKKLFEDLVITPVMMSYGEKKTITGELVPEGDTDEIILQGTIGPGGTIKNIFSGELPAGAFAEITATGGAINGYFSETSNGPSNQYHAEINNETKNFAVGQIGYETGLRQFLNLQNNGVTPVTYTVRLFEQ